MADYRWDSEQYELLDFGNGRKLERFGKYVLDRYCPAADQASKASPGLWADALSVRRDGSIAGEESIGNSASGTSPSPSGASEAWSVQCGAIQFGLKLTPFGHVGLFPEQVENWKWLDACVRRMGEQLGRPAKALNLFAYTGGSTLVLAAAGAEVVHVDASSPSVQWARRNAEASGLSARPVRWIVEDAAKFVTRELRRGNTYDLIVLDPPSFGRGPKGQRWEIEAHLPGLLSECNDLILPRQGGLLISAHCDSPDEFVIAEQMMELSRRGRTKRKSAMQIEKRRLQLATRVHRTLDAGFTVRCSYTY